MQPDSFSFSRCSPSRFRRTDEETFAKRKTRHFQTRAPRSKLFITYIADVWFISYLSVSQKHVHTRSSGGVRGHENARSDGQAGAGGGRRSGRRARRRCCRSRPTALASTPRARRSDGLPHPSFRTSCLTPLLALLRHIGPISAV